MRAAVYHRYGPPEVVRVTEVARPAPKDDEVLVRVHSASVSAADWRLRKADPFLVRLMNGLLRPKRITVLGMEMAGTVEAVGSRVTRFRPGEEVFGLTGMRLGAHADYVCLPENGTLAHKPANIGLEDCAAVLFGGFSALGFLKKAGVQPGAEVLVYGASGSVGVAAVQLAKHFGARVTAVCSGGNLDLVRSLGADELIDYAREDFSRTGRRYDIVFDAVGKSPPGACLRALKPGGAYLQILGLGLRFWLDCASNAIARKGRIIAGGAGGDAQDQAFLASLIETGALKPVIDRRYPLDEIAAAHRYVQAGHKKGNVLVLMAPALAPATP